ncbi:MAG: flavodoxin [Spirochaetales bacterium]|jgi:flavodoxin|nr:flavodoxin [Spirochaetales bacterium]
MNQVLYVSRKGNTKKVADAIAQALGVKAEEIGPQTTAAHAELLFVGGALYAGKIDSTLREFCEKLTPGQVDKVIVFSTAMSGKTAGPEIKSILKPKNISVADEAFHSKGAFLCFNRNRPGEKDLKKAGEFAKKIAGI